MTGTFNPNLPQSGDPLAVSDSKTKSSLVTLRDALNGLLTSENKIQDSSLASSNNSAYRTIFQSRGWHGNPNTNAGTYLLGSKLGSFAGMNQSAAAGGIATQRPPDVLYFDDADYAVAGKTTKLRLQCVVGVNGVAPAVTYTFGLYPLTPGGSSETWSGTVGSAVSGSTKAIASPAKNIFTPGTGSDFAVPADGAYALAVVVSAEAASGSVVACHAQLQIRWV